MESVLSELEVCMVWSLCVEECVIICKGMHAGPFVSVVKTRRAISRTRRAARRATTRLAPQLGRTRRTRRTRHSQNPGPYAGTILFAN